MPLLRWQASLTWRLGTTPRSSLFKTLISQDSERLHTLNMPSFTGQGTIGVCHKMARNEPQPVIQLLQYVNVSRFSYPQFSETSNCPFLGYRWFKCQGVPGRRNELSKITLKPNRGTPSCRGWSMNNTEATMGLTGRSQRPGIGETGRPVQHSLGEPQAELPASAVHREHFLSPPVTQTLPTPFP